MLSRQLLCHLRSRRWLDIVNNLWEHCIFLSCWRINGTSTGSLKAWRHRKAYIESWWRPSVTRGYLYLDTAPTEELLPWSASSPPLRVSDDISKIVEESGHVASIMVRRVHAILEVYREGDQGVRWYVMGEDDSIFFVDNWVDVLAKYDHTKYVYIGGHSETVMSNFYYSFDQGFGGAGFALSYPLASAMVKDLEGCIKRYPDLNSADFITKFCVDELGVSLSAKRGIHQRKKEVAQLGFFFKGCLDGA